MSKFIKGVVLPLAVAAACFIAAYLLLLSYGFVLFN